MSEARERSRDEEIQKKMVALLRAGATMLAESCPLDGYPLFKTKSGEIVCPLHGRVFIASSESEAEEIEIDYIVSKVALHAARRAYEALSNGDPDNIRAWLIVLETAERVRGLRLQTKSLQKGSEGKGDKKVE
ncbi:MAG: Sjogren's syndrome/scleroderma autoantigen 1 family protein [Acidilobaceae archaeon]